MKNLFWVGLGGVLGANARYLLGGWIAAWLGPGFPYGTLVINVSGSMILGILYGVLEARTLSPVLRLVVGIGFLGAYTTFSTFTYESIRLIEDGSLLRAFVYVAGSVLTGLAAAFLGLAAGRLV